MSILSVTRYSQSRPSALITQHMMFTRSKTPPTPLCTPLSWLGPVRLQRCSPVLLCTGASNISHVFVWHEHRVHGAIPPTHGTSVGMLAGYWSGPPPRVSALSPTKVGSVSCSDLDAFGFAFPCYSQVSPLTFTMERQCIWCFNKGKHLCVLLVNSRTGHISLQKCKCFKFFYTTPSATWFLLVVIFSFGI